MEINRYADLDDIVILLFILYFEIFEKRPSILKGRRL
jgi:hypothetical protein